MNLETVLAKLADQGLLGVLLLASLYYIRILLAQNKEMWERLVGKVETQERLNREEQKEERRTTAMQFASLQEKLSAMEKGRR